MKRKLKFIPALIMLVLCVAVIGVGIHAAIPSSTRIGGTLEIIAPYKDLDITGYINGVEKMPTDSVHDVMRWDLSGLNFDLSDKTSLEEVEDIEIKIHIKNKGVFEYGAYFYKEGAELDSKGNATINSFEDLNTSIVNSDSVKLADVTLTDYTHIMPNDDKGTNTTLDEIDMTIKISLAEFFLDAPKSKNFKYILKVESYQPNFTSDGAYTGSEEFVKMSSTISPSASSSVKTLSATPLATGTKRTTIKGGTFTNECNAKKIIIPATVETIENNAFQDCTALTHVALPRTLTSLGANTFDGCINLEYILVKNGCSVTYTLPTITKDGRISSGWYISADFNENAKVTQITPNNTGADVIYRVKWEMANLTLSPSWLTNSGITTKDRVESISFEYGSQIPDGYEQQLATGTEGIYASYKQGSNNLYNIVIWSQGNIYAPEDSSSLFMKFTNLKQISFNNFNTSNVKYMGWFDYESFNHKGMFNNCASLEIMDVSTFNTSNVEDFSTIFSGCGSLTALDVSGFNTSNATNFAGMFSGCMSLTELDLSGFNTTKATDFNSMFYACWDLTELDVSRFDTSNATNFSWMFSDCGSLTELDVSNFNTSNATDFSYMFYLCSSLTELDLSGFNVSKGTTFGNMFTRCSNLQKIIAPYTTVSRSVSIDLPSGRSFYIKGRTDLGKVSKITSDESVYGVITLSEYSSGEVTPLELVAGYAITYKDQGGAEFSGTHGEGYPLAHIYGNATILDNPSKESYTFAGWYLTSDCSGEAVTALTDANCTANITLYAKWEGADNYTLSPSWLTNSGITTKDKVETISFEYGSQIPDGYEQQLATGTEGIYASYKQGSNNLYNIVIWSQGNIYAPEDSSTLFMDFTSLKQISFNNFNTSNVKYMGNLNIDRREESNGMFAWCYSLEEIDVSTFNTSNVEDFICMFYNCKSLTELDVSGFNTKNATNFGGMFGYCSSLTELDVSGFNTSNVTDFWNMFYNCSSLTELDVSGFDTSNATSFSRMFSSCSRLTELDVSGFNTSNATSFWNMFDGCSSLTELDVSGFNTSNVTDFIFMFGSCRSLTELDLSGFDVSKGTCFYMFTGCNNLQKIIAPHTTGSSWVSIDLPSRHSYYIKGRTDLGKISKITNDASVYGVITLSEYSSGEVTPLELVAGYAITYKDQGGAEFSGTHGEGNPLAHTYDSASTQLVNPSKAGYNFAGWYLTSDCSGEPVTALTDANCTADITLYAKWAQI